VDGIHSLSFSQGCLASDIVRLYVDGKRVYVQEVSTIVGGFLSPLFYYSVTNSISIFFCVSMWIELIGQDLL